jgi:hypothetical protein
VELQNLKVLLLIADLSSCTAFLQELYLPKLERLSVEVFSVEPQKKLSNREVILPKVKMITFAHLVVPMATLLLPNLVAPSLEWIMLGEFNWQGYSPENAWNGSTPSLAFSAPKTTRVWCNSLTGCVDCLRVMNVSKTEVLEILFPTGNVDENALKESNPDRTAEWTSNAIALRCLTKLEILNESLPMNFKVLHVLNCPNLTHLALYKPWLRGTMNPTRSSTIDLGPWHTICLEHAEVLAQIVSLRMVLPTYQADVPYIFGYFPQLKELAVEVTIDKWDSLQWLIDERRGDNLRAICILPSSGSSNDDKSDSRPHQDIEPWLDRVVASFPCSMQWIRAPPLPTPPGEPTQAWYMPQEHGGKCRFFVSEV